MPLCTQWEQLTGERWETKHFQNARADSGGCASGTAVTCCSIVGAAVFVSALCAIGQQRAAAAWL